MERSDSPFSCFNISVEEKRETGAQKYQMVLVISVTGGALSNNIVYKRMEGENTRS